MRIAFIHDWNPDLEQELTWRDGLSAAVRILASRHELKFFTCGDTPFVLPHPYFPIHVVQTGDPMLEAVKEFAPDVILHWADMTRPNADIGRKLGIKQAVCFAGGNPYGEMLPNFDHVFVESAVYKQKFEERGIPVSTAFGTNTELFDPSRFVQAKYFDACFPATYCDWKRHHLLVEALRGLKVVTSGFMYQHQEQYCWQIPQDNGFLVLPHVSAETLAHLYAASKACVITSHWTGGSQRTVLEAMAMNVPLVVMSDSDKCREYVEECGIGQVADPVPALIREAYEMVVGTKVDTRAYILSKWSEHHYADALEAGLKTLL